MESMPAGKTETEPMNKSEGMNLANFDGVLLVLSQQEHLSSSKESRTTVPTRKKP